VAAKTTGDVEADIWHGNPCKKRSRNSGDHQNYGSFYRQTSNAKQEARALFIGRLQLQSRKPGPFS
jgi:hypothetical protein